MKQTPFFILLGVTVASVTSAMVMLFNTPERFTPRNESVGDLLIETFKAAEISELRIAQAEALAPEDGKLPEGDKINETVLKRTSKGWVVANRQDTEVDNPLEIVALLKAVNQFRVAVHIPAEEDHFAQMQLLAPSAAESARAYMEKQIAEGNKSPIDPRGLRLTAKGEGDKVLFDVILGPTFGEGGTDRFVGMTLRSEAGNKGIWKVMGALSRDTGSARREGNPTTRPARRGRIVEPKAWLLNRFIEVNKIKSIALSAPNDKEFVAWTVSREDENGDFTVPDLKEDEEMDTAGTGTFNSLFSSLQFEDILDAAEADSKKDSAKARKAVITTFEGFVYTFDLTPMKSEEEESDSAAPSAATNYVGTVKIEGNFKTTREKDPNETEDNAKMLDEAHKAEVDQLKFKLAREKGYEGRVYEFAQFSISSLDQARDQLVKKKAPDPPEEGETPGTPGLGKGPSAVSPAIRIPGPGEEREDETP